MFRDTGAGTSKSYGPQCLFRRRRRSTSESQALRRLARYDAAYVDYGYEQQRNYVGRNERGVLAVMPGLPRVRLETVPQGPPRGVQSFVDNRTTLSEPLKVGLTINIL